VSRLVTLNTMDHGPVTFDCPPWCIGHAWQPDGAIGRNDIAHNSVRVKAGVDTEGHGWLPLMAARISWAPFVELFPIVTVEMYVGHDFAAEDIGNFNRGLQLVQKRLEQLAAEAIRLRSDLS